MSSNDGLEYEGKAIGFEEVLPLSDLKQSALLGHILTNQNFFLQAARRIKPNWFKLAHHAKIYQFFIEQFAEIQNYPTLVEAKNYKKYSQLDNKERIAIQSSIDKAIADSTHMRLEALKPELTSWLHSKLLFDSMTKAAKLWNKTDFKNAATTLEAAVKAYHETKFEEGNVVSFDNPIEWIKKAEFIQTESLTTGLSLLDTALLNRPGCGGLQLGDTTVVLAPSNTGKTTTLLTIGRHNAQLNKKVLLMTHEGRPEDIRLKLLKCVLEVTENELFDLYKTPEGQRRIFQATETLRNNVVYIPFNKAGMKVEDVMPVIRRAQDELAAKTGGKGFDLLISDYPAKLTTDVASNGNLSMRHIQDVVYEHYVQLALELKLHSLVAIQTNRDGSRVNAGQHDKQGAAEHRLLTMEDVAEAWGPMTSASNVITLNRSPTAKRMNRMTLFVAKSRSSEVGMAVVARTDFARAITHADKLGATAYYGTSTMEDRVDNYLLSYSNVIVPAEQVFKEIGS